MPSRPPRARSPLWLATWLGIMWLFSALLHAAELKVTDKPSYPIVPHVTLLEDSDRILTIQDVLDKSNDSKFKRGEKGHLNFGYSQSAYWIKLRLKQKSPRHASTHKHTWYYEVGKAQLDSAELYIVRDNGDITRLQSDTRISYGDRPLRLVNSVFPFSLEDNETVTLYLRVENSSAFYLPVTLWKPGDFVRKVATEEFLWGIFYGGMIIMIVYNFFLYISVRDKSYLYYVSYLLFALIFEAVDMGHGAALDEEYAEWFDKRTVPFAIWMTWISAILFVQHFLEIKQRHPLLNAFLRPILMGSAICASLGLLLPFETFMKVSVYICGYAIITMPFLSGYIWYKGNRNASFFTYAWVFNVTGFVTYSTVATGIFPPTPLLVASMPLGTLIEAVMLSFALAERIKRIQKEALDANSRSIRHLAGFRSLFDNALEGIYQLSLQGRLIDANPAMARITGLTSVRTLLNKGRNSIALFMDEPNKQWQDILRGVPLHQEITRTNAANEKISVIHSARLIHDTNGRPAYIEGTFFDITERRQREWAERERLRERHEKALAEANTHAKSRFLKDMSYEIRTPLTSVIGFSESLRDPALDTSSRREALLAVTRNAQTLLQLVNDILDYSKIEAGKMSLESIDIDLMALLMHLKSVIEAMARSKGLDFVMDLVFPLPPRIISDPTRMRQILQNLCFNALKHTRDGHIRLTCRWSSDDKSLCFDVEDTGPGMDAEDIDAILQADDARAERNRRGAALGLLITRELTRLMDGSLQIKSSKGQGSCFTASIRCHIPYQHHWLESFSPQERKESSRRETPKLRGRVLLAEDNPVNQKLIERIIRKTGADVEVVGDGQQALICASHRSFDLILMDVNMPLLGGLEATKALRDAGYTLPIYALTAEHGQEEIQASLDAGCNGHLTKPIELETFNAVLTHCLTSSGDSSHEGR